MPITPRVSIAPAPAPAPAADSHEAPTSPDDQRSGTLLTGEVFDFGKGGRYTVKERLGRGAMGDVYRAEYVAPHATGVVQILALKVLRPDALPRYARTFIDEVHLLSLLRHNHIVRYHNFFVDEGGRQVLVMEYVDGRSLYSILGLARRKGRTLSESTSLELLAQVADALAYAHAAKDEAGRPLNIVHRDISPGNIMVNSSGSAVLMDFGVATADLEDRTQPGSWVIDIPGKLPYMSPEQAESRPLDGRADLFSLCSILVEMLTGEPPFGRALKHATWEAIRNVTPRYVARVTRGLSRKVRAICRKALAPHPEDRFASAREMAAAMLAGLPRRSPEAVRDEIAALEKLPDAPAKTEEEVDRSDAAPRRATRKLRALKWTGALACAAVACFFFVFWNARMKPEAATPAVADAAPISLPHPSAQGPVQQASPLATACAMMPGCAPILTGTKAGDCYHVVQHGFPGIVVPDVMCVGLDEPCPFYDGKKITMRMTGDGVEERKWYGPPGHDGPAPSLLIGTTKILDVTGKYQNDFGRPLRDYSQRMTALITEIRTYDGNSVPVCGVLFGQDDKEGVPIFRSPEDGKPFGGAWGKARVKFFWPKKLE